MHHFSSLTSSSISCSHNSGNHGESNSYVDKIFVPKQSYGSHLILVVIFCENYHQRKILKMIAIKQNKKLQCNVPLQILIYFNFYLSIVHVVIELIVNIHHLKNDIEENHNDSFQAIKVRYIVSDLNQSNSCFRKMKN